jgi:hypothetical protein
VQVQMGMQTVEPVQQLPMLWLALVVLGVLLVV